MEWPGWCRSGRDEASALEALLASAPSYRRALARRRIAFRAPRGLADLRVTAHHAGNATTDFGAPGIPPTADERPLSPAQLRELRRAIEACWAELDAMAAAAKGRTLRRGPRGGGRDLEAILRHVTEAEAGYLSALGWKTAARTPADVRNAVLEGLAASARGEIPARGPRGGERWRPRFFTRRLAWHALDHAWEIEDRATSS